MSFWALVYVLLDTVVFVLLDTVVSVLLDTVVLSSGHCGVCPSKHYTKN
jgi:hypothetical protein